MENSFELLEEQVKRAAGLVRRLRDENRTLEQDVGQAKAALREVEKRLVVLEKDRQAPQVRAKEIEILRGEIGSLRKEREEVRDRIERVVETLEALD
jgi:predicted RNase H-like nuclease (RuvC/YqgF family)